MKKYNKFFYFLFVLLLIVGIFLGIYKLLEHLNYQSLIEELENYKLKNEEKILKEFLIADDNYAISMYYDNTSSWSHLNILFKDKEKYYLLENIKKCDTSDGSNIYIKDNEIYIHCIGKMGDIDKYLVNNLKVTKDTLYFNYQKTPNISQIHMNIDKVDDDYIYLYSLKNDSTIKNGEKVKCSFEDRKCSYY